jgi:hypothetical protein
MELIMETNQNNIEKYLAAKKQVREIKGFYGNLILYILVNLFLLFINLKYSPDDIWFFWPMIGWGIGVAFHGMKVFNYMPFLGKDWENRKISEYMKEEEKKNNLKK